MNKVAALTMKRDVITSDMNREINIFLIAKLGIALGNWQGECNVNSCKDRQQITGEMADTPDPKWEKEIRTKAFSSSFVVNKISRSIVST